MRLGRFRNGMAGSAVNSTQKAASWNDLGVEIETASSIPGNKPRIEGSGPGPEDRKLKADQPGADGYGLEPSRNLGELRK